MACWILSLVEYNFELKYKAGKQNVSAGTLSRLPDYKPDYVTTMSSPTEALIRVAYPRDSQCVE